MSKVVVWRCDQTGKLFEDHSKYKNHLRRLARERQQRRKLEIVAAEADAWWAVAYEREMSIGEFKTFIIENQSRFWQEAACADTYGWDNVGRTRRGIVCPVPQLLEFTVFDLRWSDMVGNTHSCPHNGVTNWWSRDNPDLPRGYPGWTGRVEWLVGFPEEWSGVYIGGDLFKGHRSRCYSGGGGGGGGSFHHVHNKYAQRFSYEFKLYAADWPGMARVKEMDQIARRLKGLDR